LKHSAKKIVTVSNTTNRVNEIKEEAAMTLKAGVVSAAGAAAIRGRVLFADQQCFGRIGALATRSLGKRANGPTGFTKLDEDARRSYKWIKKCMDTNVPRSIAFGAAARPVLIFVDGACEPSDTRLAVTPNGVDSLGCVTCGAVLIDGDVREGFGLDVPKDVVKLWKAGGKEQVIGQAEAYPILLAKWTWEKRLRQRRCIYFVDNNSARYAVVAMSSPVAETMRIIEHIAIADLESRAINWYTRVPSFSNIADAPSRLAFDEFEGFGITKLDAVIRPMVQNVILNFAA
jgi:hypothetical protein